jgi:hypothetical protein
MPAVARVRGTCSQSAKSSDGLTYGAVEIRGGSAYEDGGCAVAQGSNGTIKSEDVRQAIGNVVGFFTMLASWNTDAQEDVDYGSDVAEDE